MILHRIILAAFVATGLAGCETAVTKSEVIVDIFPTPSPFEGRWVEVKFGLEGGGFELAIDGTATTIDTFATTYLSWRADGNTLYLTTAEDGEVGYIAYLSDDGNLHLGDAGDTFDRVFRKIP